MDNGKDGDGYPLMGSVVAKFKGSNDPYLPAFVGLADSWVADVWESGQMGSEFAPVKGSELAGRFKAIGGPRRLDPHYLETGNSRESSPLQTWSKVERSTLLRTLDG